MEHIKPSNMPTFRVFTTTLTYVVYWQAHFDTNYCNLHNSDRLSTEGTEESYRNELDAEITHNI